MNHLTTRLGLIILSLGMLWLSSCSTDESSEAGNDSLASEASVSAGQAWAFEDGKVDRSEYALGFENFVRCAAEAGAEVTRSSVDPDTGEISYFTPADKDVVVTKCYEEQFNDIDMKFQTTDPAILESRDEELLSFLVNTVFPCLEKNGISTPEVPDPQDSGDFIRQHAELASEARC